MAARALECWDRGLRFGVMQLPLDRLEFHHLSFQREVLPGLAARGIGVVAMKTSADGALLREGLCSIDGCLQWAWLLPVSVAWSGWTALSS